MGVTVYSRGREVWSPASKVGYLFLAEVNALEVTFDVKSGVTSSLADELEIDSAAFAAFIQKIMAALENTNNRPFIILSAGFLQVAIALSASITGEWPAIPTRLQPFLSDARNVMVPLLSTERPG